MSLRCETLYSGQFGRCMPPDQARRQEWFGGREKKVRWSPLYVVCVFEESIICCVDQGSCKSTKLAVVVTFPFWSGVHAQWSIPIPIHLQIEMVG